MGDEAMQVVNLEAVRARQAAPRTLRLRAPARFAGRAVRDRPAG